MAGAYVRPSNNGDRADCRFGTLPNIRGMSSGRKVDPGELRAAVAATVPWLEGRGQRPARADLSKAVKLSLRSLAAVAPGNSVEVRVPPFAAVQCVSGPGHTRGTPPNVVEAEPRAWLLMALGRLDWQRAVEDGVVSASGARADLSHWLPLLRIDDADSIAE